VDETLRIGSKARPDMKLQVSWMDKIASQGGTQDLINMQTHVFAATVPDTVPPPPPPSSYIMNLVTKLAPDRMLG
jgi:hypothetical protein